MKQWSGTAESHETYPARFAPVPKCVAERDSVRRQRLTSSNAAVKGARNAMGETVADFLLKRLDQWGIKRIY